jgi:F-type H+-transporting ATPase subunit b
MINTETIAQVLTTLLAFGIFFWVTKLLFWKPMRQTINDRQSRIREEFDRIDSMQRQIDALQADYNKRMADIEAEARQKMQEAIAEGRKISEDIGAQARKDAEALQQRTHEAMTLEMEKARVQLKQEVVKMTLAATEKLIRQEMSDARQRDLVSSFVEELAHK